MTRAKRGRFAGLAVAATMAVLVPTGVAGAAQAPEVQLSAQPGSSSVLVKAIGYFTQPESELDVYVHDQAYGTHGCPTSPKAEAAQVDKQIQQHGAQVAIELLNTAVGQGLATQGPFTEQAHFGADTPYGQYWACAYLLTPLNLQFTSEDVTRAAMEFTAGSPSTTMAAEVFPTCSPRATPRGLGLSCPVISDSWPATARSLSFAVFVDSSEVVMGDLKVQVFSAQNKDKAPVYTRDYGRVTVPLSGSHTVVDVSFRQPGTYEVATYFNGALIGWAPVNIGTSTRYLGHSALVSAAVVPSGSCTLNVQSGQMGCSGITDRWAASGAQLQAQFGIAVYTTEQATGDVQVRMWSPYATVPLSKRDYGKVTIGPAGYRAWVGSPPNTAIDQPGDYWVGVYFNNQLVGWSPVNWLGPQGVCPKC